MKTAQREKTGQHRKQGDLLLASHLRYWDGSDSQGTGSGTDCCQNFSDSRAASRDLTTFQPHSHVGCKCVGGKLVVSALPLLTGPEFAGGTNFVNTSRSERACTSIVFRSGWSYIYHITGNFGMVKFWRNSQNVLLANLILAIYTHSILCMYTGQEFGDF